MIHINTQRGQSATEYIVALIIVMVMLGAGIAGQGSVIDMFLDAVREGFEKYSSFISLP